MILPPDLIEIAQEGHRRSGEVLPIFMALLVPHVRTEFTSVQDEEMPAETMVGPIPRWCLDMYTRPGRAALAKLIEGSTETARWVRARGFPNPTRSPLVRATLRGIKRTYGCAQRQAKALCRDDLLQVLDATGNSVKDLRDRALLLVGFAGALRRSELVGLNQPTTIAVGSLRRLLASSPLPPSSGLAFASARKAGSFGAVLRKISRGRPASKLPADKLLGQYRHCLNANALRL